MMDGIFFSKIADSWDLVIWEMFCGKNSVVALLNYFLLEFSTQQIGEDGIEFDERIFSDGLKTIN